MEARGAGPLDELQAEGRGSMTNLCIDLCSGLGGFSQAFVDAGWEVVTVDIDGRFNPTITANILTLSAKKIEKVTKKGRFGEYEKVVVLASPPCERFSIANSDWPQKGTGRALRIVAAVIDLITEIRPDAWLLENPTGRLQWFLGKPPHSVKQSDYGRRVATQGGKERRPYKPTDLWGNVNLPLVASDTTGIEVVRAGTGFTKDARAKRAEIAYGLSQAILEAVSQP